LFSKDFIDKKKTICKQTMLNIYGSAARTSGGESVQDVVQDNLMIYLSSITVANKKL
jgi:hypothetical protein